MSQYQSYCQTTAHQDRFISGDDSEVDFDNTVTARFITADDGARRMMRAQRLVVMSGFRIVGMRHKAIETRRAAFETGTPRLCE